MVDLAAVRDCLCMITPSDAKDMPSLEAAVDFAMIEVDAVIAEATEIASKSSAFLKYEIAGRQALKGLMRRRNDWLKEHDAFRVEAA